MVLTFAQNLQRLRGLSGLSQAELARRVGTLRQIVWGWERSRGEPNLEQLRRLAEALTCSVDLLLQRELTA